MRARDARDHVRLQPQIVVTGDELRFRTEAGSIVRFARHAGEKEFPGCD
jgi:hypothetical protein